MEKKGQANVLVVVLIILIVLVAIAIVWNVVSVLVSEKSKEVGLGGLTVSLDIKEVILFETGPMKVTINRGTGEGEIDNLKFVFYNEVGESSIVTKESIGILQTKTYSFSPVGTGNIKKVSVVPVVGNKLGIEIKSGVDKISEIPSGLVSWWRFDRDTSDFLGRNNNCQLINGSSVSDNVLTGSLSCPDNNSLDISEKISISFWIKTNANDKIIKKGDNYKAFLDGGLVNFSYGDNKISSDDRVDLSNNSWHHVVVDSDGIYLDGKNNKGFIWFNSQTNNKDLIIGYISGELDELMIFNKSLTKDQANALYENQKIMFS